jgi:hypothetical protein
MTIEPIDVKEILTILLSWQTVSIVVAITLRTPLKNIINRLIASDTGKAKIGPIEIELGKLAADGQLAIDKLNEINLIMAKSRAQELEITLNTFGQSFSKQQQQTMTQHIEKLKSLSQDKQL